MAVKAVKPSRPSNPSRTKISKPHTTTKSSKLTKSMYFDTPTPSMASAPTTKPTTTTTKTNPKVTDFQERVYAALLQIPPGRVSTYAALSAFLNSSPRAVGGALRCNPFAPEVPCHRIISSTRFIGGFKGDWEAAPSGVNITLKQNLLKEEGVVFDERGFLVSDKDGGRGGGGGGGSGKGRSEWVFRDFK